MRVESLRRFRRNPQFTHAAAFVIASVAVFAIALSLAVIGVGATLAMALQPSSPFRW